MEASNPFISALAHNDQNRLKLFSKLIALEIRNELEDFHIKSLTDTQMKELNPLIRNAVYNVLFALSNMERQVDCAKTVGFLMESIPDYWEEPMLNDFMQKANNEILSREIVFDNEFLNEQLRRNNIKYFPGMALIQLAMKHEYNDVKDNERDKHKGRIISALKKEGYEYDFGLDGYKKPIWK